MPEPHTYHLPNSTLLFCSRVNRLGQTEPLQRHDADFVISDMTELGGWQ